MESKSLNRLMFSPINETAKGVLKVIVKETGVSKSYARSGARHKLCIRFLIHFKVLKNRRPHSANALKIENGNLFNTKLKENKDENFTATG